MENVRRLRWLGRHQIDYIMVKKGFRNLVKSSTSYPGVNINSDHNIVVIKYNLKFKRIAEKKIW